MTSLDTESLSFHVKPSRRPTRARARALAILIGLAACETGPSAQPTATPVSAAPPAPAPSSLPELLAAVDRAHPGPAVREALRSQDPARRSAALRLAVPLVPATLPTRAWLDALLSPDSVPRLAAAQALLGLPPAPALPVLRALAAEEDPHLRALLLRALGRTDPPVGPRPFYAALSHPAPRTHMGACLGLAHAPLPLKEVPYAEIGRLLEAHAPASNPSYVRTACASALALLPAPPDPDAARALAHDLDAALDDPDPEVRLLAATALGHYPATDLPRLASALDDPDWRVAAAAYRAYVVHASPESYDASLRQLLEAALANPTVLRGPRVHVWSSALRAAVRLPDEAARLALAEQAAERFSDGPLDQDPSPAVAAAHCELAAWVDAQRRWPGRLRACGDGLAPAQLGYFHEARLVAAQPSNTALRAHYLATLLKRGPEARTAVLSAAGRVRHESLLEPLGDLIAHGSDADAGRAARAALELLPVVPQDHPDRRALAGALRRRLSALPAGASSASLIATLDALAALDLPQPNPALLKLCGHPSPEVAAAARRLLSTALDEAELPRAPSPEGLSVDEFLDAPRDLRLTLPHGELQIRLDPALAPSAVPRLVAAVDAGWLVGAPLSVRATPPEAGLGDPYASVPAERPLWVRRDFTAAPCERGSVVLVQAAPRSETLALRVLLSRRPELDGQVTQVGRVISGLEALEASLLGQTVRAVSQPPRPLRTDVSP